MQITALRSISTKINHNVVQNCRRLFSFKYEVTPGAVHSHNAPDQASDSTTAPLEPPAKLEVPSPAFRYNVCQPRTSPVDRPSPPGEAQRINVKAAIEEQHLQPAMLPEYYQKQMERNVLINPQPEPNETDRIEGSSHHQRFQVSKTYANAILPLKNGKLANPFPEPVKMMMSRTVADDEKAEQMLAESRSQKQFTANWGRRPAASIPPARTYSTCRRWYSMSETVHRDPKKCKKFPGGKKQCSKMNLPNCPRPARKNCNRIPTDLNCKKQQSPYPAYSEFCHEEIDEKPSECKMCPWKPEENPNFKPPKKYYHTSIIPLCLMKRTGLELERGESKRKLDEDPNSYVTEEDGMLCDLKKPPCNRPNNRRCPPTKEEKQKAEEEKRRRQREEKKCESEGDSAYLVMEGEPVEEMELAKKPNDKRHGPCKIKRFPFPKCQYPQREDQSGARCPVKKRKPMVDDCPPCGKCSYFSPAEAEQAARMLEAENQQQGGYQMRKNEVGKDRKKCPHVDMTVDREEVDDPCNLRRKGVTKICPADLLKKKRKKPKRKASGVVIPPQGAVTEPKKDAPQQPTTRVP